MKSKIKVKYAFAMDKNDPFELIFPDWYDFADWVKQYNLSGTAIIIYSWEYVL